MKRIAILGTAVFIGLTLLVPAASGARDNEPTTPGPVRETPPRSVNTQAGLQNQPFTPHSG